MKKIKSAILILTCISIFGCCSLPAVANYSQLYCLTKETRKVKGTLGKKVTLINDFRGNEKYDEDITALKETVEKYVSTHNDLSEQAKNNLRELKISAGATKEETRLLLGEPDKVMEAGANAYAASEIWVYRTAKASTFTVVFIPVLFSREGYYLYFKGDILAAIERHYLKQTFESRGIELNEETGEKESQ